MKWAHQGILRSGSMEQSKGVYELRKCVHAHSPRFIYSWGQEDKTVEEILQEELASKA